MFWWLQVFRNEIIDRDQYLQPRSPCSCHGAYDELPEVENKLGYTLSITAVHEKTFVHSKQHPKNHALKMIFWVLFICRNEKYFPLQAERGALFKQDNCRPAGNIHG